MTKQLSPIYVKSSDFLSHPEHEADMLIFGNAAQFVGDCVVNHVAEVVSGESKFDGNNPIFEKLVVESIAKGKVTPELGVKNA